MTSMPLRHNLYAEAYTPTESGSPNLSPTWCQPQATAAAQDEYWRAGSRRDEWTMVQPTGLQPVGDFTPALRNTSLAVVGASLGAVGVALMGASLQGAALLPVVALGLVGTLIATWGASLVAEWYLQHVPQGGGHQSPVTMATLTALQRGPSGLAGWALRQDACLNSRLGDHWPRQPLGEVQRRLLGVSLAGLGTTASAVACLTSAAWAPLLLPVGVALTLLGAALAVEPEPQTESGRAAMGPRGAYRFHAPPEVPPPWPVSGLVAAGLHGLRAPR